MLKSIYLKIGKHLYKQLLAIQLQLQSYNCTSFIFSQPFRIKNLPQLQSIVSQNTQQLRQQISKLFCYQLKKLDLSYLYKHLDVL